MSSAQQQVRQVQDEQGWTDETLSGLALEFVLDVMPEEFLRRCRQQQRQEQLFASASEQEV